MGWGQLNLNEAEYSLSLEAQSRHFQGEACHQTVLLLVRAEDMPRSPFFSQGCSVIPGPQSYSDLAPLLVLPQP